MAEPRKNQVSLRGASAKEITRDALLEKVSQERELRNYARRAANAALFIQRVWRGHYAVKMISLELQDEWRCLVNAYPATVTRTWISTCLMRPFLFFISNLSVRHRILQTRDIECVQICFKALLDSINSTDSDKNFCSLATGTVEERKVWRCQVRKLICLCLFILGKLHSSCQENKDMVIVTSLGTRLLVLLTDLHGWKSICNENMQDADVAVKDLITFMGRYSGLYISIRKYISKLNMTSENSSCLAPPDDQFLITASAITLALRTVHATKFDVNSPDSLGLQHSVEQFIVLIFTIPWISLRIPSILLPALKHNSVLSPCFRSLMIFKEKMLQEMSNMDQLNEPFCSRSMPQVGWALANTICLAMEHDRRSSKFGQFSPGLDLAMYVHAIIIYAENFLSWLDNIGCIKKENQEEQSTLQTCTKPTDIIMSANVEGPSNITYMEQYMPVCQQWHLSELLEASKKGACSTAENNQTAHVNLKVKFELLDIAYFYSYMLRIFSALNSTSGTLPILNMLSFTPGFLVDLWQILERFLFPKSAHSEIDICSKLEMEGNKGGALLERQLRASKDGNSKWASLIHKFAGKPHTDVGSPDLGDIGPQARVFTIDTCDVWDFEPFKHGAQGISKDMLCLLHLFCASYSHLLLVLDDIEFYEKQIPFTLAQQRRIASVLNTLVYNDLTHGGGPKNKSLMDAAIRCLHLLYQRDCRHQFCPPNLWLSPARKNRPPIAAAARAHEVYSVNQGMDDFQETLSMDTVTVTTPHVFPFEERVQMFREFIKMDKVSRRMAGEVAGPGPSSVEIVIRRGHIVDDGFQQLNSLGSKMKSAIHVSFVSECGLPEAGLDYGGLTKEFLTDITKAAFSPDHGLFTQTSSPDALLIPNIGARSLANGIQMIEFLGRVVGKALYDGILLDYSFSHVFVQKLLGRYSFLDELSTLDPELYRNLMFVKHYDGDVQDLSLDFTVTEDLYGKRHVIELRPGGKDVIVTNDNKLQYIHAIADFKLNRQILPLSNAFYRGLADLISPAWLKLFNANEFNQLLSGGNHDIDIDDLRNNTRYSGGYSEGSRPIKLFWEVFAGFEPKDRCMLLKFVTSCSRGPLLGFKHLQPTFTIHKVACDMPLWATIGGQDVERLPSASTCYNTLKLPTYKRQSTMRAKLLYAINSNAGFELS